MTKSEAIAFVERIKEACKKKGVWYDVKEANRPKLGMIEITVSIKVDKEGEAARR